MGNHQVNYKNKTFEEEKIELDGKYFFNCTFKNCLFILETGNTGFKGCEISGCRLLLRGNAYTVAKIISKLNRKGTFKIIDFEEPLVEDKINGKVMAVCSGEKKGKPKGVKETIFLKPGHGVEGDAHAGTGREVSLLGEEDILKFTRETGLKAPPGCFAENIRVRWFSPVDLKIGARLAVGKAEVKVTGRGKPDSEQHDYSYEGYSLTAAKGIFVQVIQSGEVRAGDPVRLTGWEK